MAPGWLLAVSSDLVDGVHVAALVLLAAWGGRRGLPRQLAGLAVVAASFAVASALSPRVVGSVEKVATLSPAGTAAVAWLAVWGATAVLGGLGIHLLAPAFDRMSAGGAMGRVAGALVGVVQGAVLLALGSYAILGAHVGEAFPPSVEALRSSRTARAVTAAELRVGGALRLPAPVAERVRDVNAAVLRSAR